MGMGRYLAMAALAAGLPTGATAQETAADQTPPVAATTALPADRILTETPGPRALALGRDLAESGTLASLLPLLIVKDTEDLVAEFPDLSAAETARLRAIAADVAASGSERLFAAQARAYAMRLSEADLAVLAEAARSPAQARFRAALPFAIAATMAGVGELDLKKDIRAAWCKETGKGCEE
jgi:hypothetical protein